MGILVHYHKLQQRLPNSQQQCDSMLLKFPREQAHSKHLKTTLPITCNGHKDHRAVTRCETQLVPRGFIQSYAVLGTPPTGTPTLSLPLTDPLLSQPCILPLFFVSSSNMHGLDTTSITWSQLTISQRRKEGARSAASHASHTYILGAVE